MLAGFEAANTAFRIGDFKECIAVCIRGTRDALREGNDAEFWQFRCLLALCLGTQGSSSPHSVDYATGFFLSRMGDYLPAKNLLDQAARLARRESKEALLAEVQLNRMTLLFYLADYDAMEDCARAALTIAQEPCLGSIEAGAYSGIGKSLMVRSRFREAITCYERARALFLREGLRFQAAAMSSELGSCCYGLQEDEKALELFSEALKAALDAGALPSYQINLANIGNLHLRRGEYAAAISNYQKALSIAHDLGDWISLSKWLRNLAIAYSQMGSPEIAGFAAFGIPAILSVRVPP